MSSNLVACCNYLPLDFDSILALIVGRILSPMTWIYQHRVAWLTTILAVVLAYELFSAALERHRRSRGSRRGQVKLVAPPGASEGPLR